MNTRQTVPLSTYRDVIKGTFSLSPVALPGMECAHMAPGSFVLGVASSRALYPSFDFSSSPSPAGAAGPGVPDDAANPAEEGAAAAADDKLVPAVHDQPPGSHLCPPALQHQRPDDLGPPAAPQQQLSPGLPLPPAAQP